ncbi:MAG TPA: hypothetical protein VGL97_07860, partial [Bryobacteraceae bacterium]
FGDYDSISTLPSSLWGTINSTLSAIKKFYSCEKLMSKPLLLTRFGSALHQPVPSEEGIEYKRPYRCEWIVAHAVFGRKLFARFQKI